MISREEAAAALELANNQALASALEKVAANKPMTKEERAALEGAVGAAGAGVEVGGLVARFLPLSSGTRSALTRQIQRMNACAKKDGVPVPWNEPEKLPGWFARHYRATGDSPSGAKVPGWILAAAGGKPAPASVAAPVEVTPGSDLEALERTVALARQRMEQAPGDVIAERGFREAMEQASSVRARLLRNPGEYVSAAAVESAIVDVFGDVVGAIVKSLVESRNAAATAAASPDLWAEFARGFAEKFGEAVGRGRLIAAVKSTAAI